MNSHIQSQVRNLIRETNIAYGIFSENSGANADYAEFAAQALCEFKDLLKQPSLTHWQLSNILRQGSYQHKTSAPKSCWASFLAAYVSNAVNMNTLNTAVETRH